MTPDAMGDKQVIVPLTSDVADFYNDSGGTVQLVADLDGYFSAGATSSFALTGRPGSLTPASASARKLAPFRRTARW
jgi:hypothetical protein